MEHDGVIRILYEQLEMLAREKDWRIAQQKAIPHGMQVLVTDGAESVPINLYASGKVNVQGRDGLLKSALVEWANALQGAPKALVSVPSKEPASSMSFYVKPEYQGDVLEKLHTTFVDQCAMQNPQNSWEAYIMEITDGATRVKVIQYHKGTLLVQGADSHLKHQVLETLLEHPRVEFAHGSFLDLADAWLRQELPPAVFEFLHPRDHQSLRSAGAVLIAVKRFSRKLPLTDYGILAMPFYRVLEGFIKQLYYRYAPPQPKRIPADSHDSRYEKEPQTMEMIAELSRINPTLVSELKEAWFVRNRFMHPQHDDMIPPVDSLQEVEQAISKAFWAMGRIAKYLQSREQGGES